MRKAIMSVLFSLGSGSSVRVDIAPSRHSPRNGSQKTKKKELVKARKNLNFSTIMSGWRVVRDRRRLRDAEVKFAAHQRTRKPCAYRCCNASRAVVSTRVMLILWVGSASFSISLLVCHECKILAHGPTTKYQASERQRAGTFVVGALAPAR